MPVVRTPVKNRPSYLGSRATRARSHSAKSIDITALPYHAAATPQSAVRGWSPVPASNAPTPSLSLAERKQLGGSRHGGSEWRSLKQSVLVRQASNASSTDQVILL